MQALSVLHHGVDSASACIWGRVLELHTLRPGKQRDCWPQMSPWFGHSVLASAVPEMRAGADAYMLTCTWCCRAALLLQAEIGVDAGAYARLLMVHAKEAADAAVEDLAAGTLSPQAILESAFYRTNVQGAWQAGLLPSSRCLAIAAVFLCFQ